MGESLRKNPTLSIIVPIYNVEEFLEACVQSILNQSFNDFELILVNDGSTDKSLDICKAYEVKDNRIVVLNKKNGGVSSARNLGMRVAKGEYLAFVDPDDDIKENMYEKMIAKIIETKVDVVISSFNYIDLNTNIVKQQKLWCEDRVIDDRVIKRYLLRDFLEFKGGYGIPSVWNKIYRKSIINKFHIYFDENKHHSEDLKFNLEILTKVKSLYFFKKPFYNYYIRERESLTRVVREDLYKYILSNKKLYNSLCKKYNHIDCIDKVRTWYITTTIHYMINISKSNKKVKTKFKIMKEILNDDTFKANIKGYDYPNSFYGLLRFASLIKSTCLFYIFVRLLMIKESLNKIIRK